MWIYLFCLFSCAWIFLKSDLELGVEVFCMLRLTNRWADFWILFRDTCKTLTLLRKKLNVWYKFFEVLFYVYFIFLKIILTYWSSHKIILLSWLQQLVWAYLVVEHALNCYGLHWVWNVCVALGYDIMSFPLNLVV